jgi:1A family penicillin-binding protein
MAIRGRPNGQGIRSTRKRHKPSGRGWKWLLLFTGMGIIAALSGVIVTIFGAISAAAAGYATLNQDLPALSEIDNHQTFKTAQIYDRKGKLLWEFYDSEGGRRTVVPLSEISQWLIDASLAAEDANFYTNPGIDPRGIARAMWQNFSEQELVSGASTITQQLVRHVYMTTEERFDRSMSRKIKEALLAYQLTQKMTKSQILQMYLNEIYYGNMAYGVQAAAETYFAKSARDLTLAESALIAGLAQAPVGYDPYRNPASAKERQIYVLDQMERHGFITEAEAEQAKNERLAYKQIKRDFLAPHWVMYIRDQIEQKYGPKFLSYGGLKIITTLDLDLQNQLQEVAQANAPTLAQRDANNTAILATNPKTGEILAMVGSMDYFNSDIDGQVNVTVSQRQPGSSIKPLVYLSSFARDYLPSTQVKDEPISLVDDLGRAWKPLNFDKRFYGTVTLRSALGNSLNIPAVKVLEHVGIDGVLDLAKKLGINTWNDRNRLGMSLTLGGAEVRPLQLAGVYATLANNGRYIPLVGISKLIDADGNVIEDYRVPQGDQVVDPRAAYMVTDVLRDNNARLITYGPNSLLKTTRPAAVKTGTTDNFRDTWTAGYTPNLVVVAWVGNSDGHPMKEVLSSMSAGKIWREALDASADLLQLPPEDFPRPDGLINTEVCGDGQMRPGVGQCYQEIFPYERAPKQNRVYLPGAAPPPQTNVQPQATAAPTAEGGQPQRGGTSTTGQTVPRADATNQTPANQVQANPTSSTRPGSQPTPRATAAPAQPTASRSNNTPQPRAQPTAASKPAAQPTSQRNGNNGNGNGNR